MRKLITAVVMLWVLTTMAAAQLSGGNIFVGYSYARATVAAPAFPPDTGGILVPRNTGLNGWNASVEGKLLPFIGIVADVSGHYGSQRVTDECGFIAGCVPTQDQMDATMYTFLVGPRVSFSVGRVRPFVHALLGGGHLSESTKTRTFSGSDTAFAYALGGGLDYRLAGPLRWRVQGDFLKDRFFGGSQNNFRFSTGVVLHF